MKANKTACFAGTVPTCFDKEVTFAKAVVEKHLDWSAASRRYAAD